MKKDDITFDTIMKFSPDNKDVFEEILEHMKNNNLVPFVGAGLSSFVYPCWSDFLKEIAKKLSERDYDSIEFLLKEFKYEEAASLLCDKRGYSNFNADISRIFSETELNEVNLYKQAVYILPKLFNNLVITTNIDRILERVFSENKKEIFSCFPGNSEPFISAMKRGTPTIFKIHGDISSKNNLVLTKEQYDETYVEDCTLIDQLSQCFENKIHLFLGCSLQADRTVPILENIQKKQNRVVPDYTIYPCSASDKYAKMQSFGQRGIRAILYPENSHHSVRIVLEALLERIDRDEYLKLEYRNGKPLINSPIQRYQYDAATVDFFGRENEMNQLLAFCENNNNVHLQWWAVTGDGGCGKSRLALELEKKLNSLGWESYIHDKMDFTDLKATSRKICKSTIFIIDSIEAYPEEVGKWIESLNQPTSTIRKRIILIAREGNNIKTPWVKSMKKSCLSDNMLNGICYQNEFLRLSSLPKDITKDIIKNYAASVHECIDDEQADKIYQGLEKIDGTLHRPLYALILVDTYFENNFTLPKDINSVLEILVLREIKIISNLLKAKINASDDQFEELILRIKVIATIVRGIDVNNLENYLDIYDYNLLYEKLKKYNNDDLISFLKKIYVIEDNGNLIKPIKPDLIGEYFVVHVLKSEMRFECYRP
ncbi:SIR2 family protein [Anaerotignum propionicum]|uniref:SIR2-like domain-containing protein n=1 Tax=Anaerotignum propionicum DSM 1682 TaxID=991789 RepID=A0A0X1U7K7_ANAPI|nr:SIR2 family protein [Anaerotignum propionicum]AMJ40915.1 hypothetical protein CPRO_13220 [Anaerotignum propionicum DSM 1682]SHE76289.1 SIR2-like domain-containing protein [[Clostridium] propionicum DSM 1682] [Anaerotignum propionicum DSM 1682]